MATQPCMPVGSKSSKLKNLLKIFSINLAAEKGHLNVVKTLLKHKANVDSKENEGYTPLHLGSFLKSSIKNRLFLFLLIYSL